MKFGLLDRYLPLKIYRLFQKVFDKAKIAQNVELYNQIITKMTERLNIVKILDRFEEINILAENMSNIHSEVKSIKEYVDLMQKSILVPD